MRKISRLIPLLLLAFQLNAQNNDSIVIKKIYSEILTNGTCYSNLDYLCNRIGGRLAGSLTAQRAVDWAKINMKKAGADNVVLQECMVPHWERGEKEKAYVVCGAWDSRSEDMDVCALGGSIATPPEGLSAEVVEVKSLEEVYKLGRSKIAGKIVFFNRPFDNTEINPFAAYGKAVDQRGYGPSVAAKFGAIASICRSMTPNIDDFPHTGAMHYLDSIPEKIPACAISTLDAERLSELIKKGMGGVYFHLKMSCKTLPDEKSFNVVGEIKGSEFPEEIIVVGGHLDSWDTGDGAHDDGSGVVQAIEVIRVMKALGIKPKRTIRAVAFMNEENGAMGGRKYAELAKQNKEKHIFAIESDAGGTVPRGFGFEVPQASWEKVLLWKKLFEPYNTDKFEPTGSGYDISFLAKDGVPVGELNPDPQRYFDFHHTANDIFKNVNERELKLGAAGMAALIYLISEYGL